MEPGIFYITPVKNEIKIHLYLDWSWSREREFEVGVLKPIRGNRFGELIVNDWPVYDSSGPNKKIVARARGKHVQASMGQELGWFFTLNLVFKDDRFNGSTIQVMGNNERDSEWAIVGGTGEFTNAHGILRKKILQETNGMRFFEVNIHAHYTPPRMTT